MEETESDSATIGALIDKFRFSQGWKPLEETDHANTVATFLDALYANQVPSRYWSEIYNRAIRFRAEKISHGFDAPTFAPELFLAVWQSLRVEIEHDAVASKRQLPSNAASACLRCFGTNFERMYSNGEYVGVRPGCKHESLSDKEREERKL